MYRYVILTFLFHHRTLQLTLATDFFYESI